MAKTTNNETAEEPRRRRGEIQGERREGRRWNKINSHWES